MSVSLCNEVWCILRSDGRYSKADAHAKGPVTFTIDSRKFEYVDQSPSGTSTPKGKSKGANTRKATATLKTTGEGANAVTPKSESPDAGAQVETNRG